ncbi:S8 family peptidase [Defluviimonas sp. WL0075]|uniref:S8 family serine peptidase n=1 Tax=Albidovulum sediminicola TaxID=2984331 RepID=A0ABT2Z3R8_9RHOB|nr:S8 family peptidase [Defluviimonas sp. WL0075]MCV2865785.1 S8 family serine peptidase [Defluviimonas sp. WL0075]
MPEFVSERYSSAVQGPVRLALLRSTLCGTALLALAACGGGGDGDGGGSGSQDEYSVNVPVPPDSGGTGILGSYYVSTFAPYEALAAQLRTSALYTIQRIGASFAPIAARVEYAHAVGLTGKGQVISIVDAGFRKTHETIADSIIQIQPEAETSLDPDGRSHGTMVASIAAGYSDTIVGVAPNASLLLGSFNTDSTLARATNAALSNGAVAQNNSWGLVDGTTFGTLYATPENFQAVFGSGTAYTRALQAYSAQGVVVFAVSNDTTDTMAGLMEGLPLLMPELESGWLAVANALPDYDANGINSVQLVSAACLEAAAWCLLADGTWYGATASGDASYGIGYGSSFAAPQVTGALALLAEAFPNLTPHQLRLRLLASADNSFFTPDQWLEIENGLKHGYNDTYGHGFLDIRAALLPIGTPKVTLANGIAVTLEKPPVVAGSAFGDSISRSLSSVNISVTDSLDAEFRTPGGALTATAGLPELGTARLARAFSTGLEARRVASLGGFSDSFESFPGRTVTTRTADTRLSASVLMPEGGTGDYGISVSTALAEGPTRLDLGLKVARDQGTVLGLGDDGAGSDLFAVQLALSQELAGDTFVSLTGEVGRASLAQTEIFSDVSSASFDSVGLEVGRRNLATKGDRLAFGARLPMAVTSGKAEAVLPVFSRATGTTSYEPIAIDLAPEARQLDLSVSYQRPVGDNLELMLELVHSKNQGNRAGEQDSAAVLALTWAF